MCDCLLIGQASESCPALKDGGDIVQLHHDLLKWLSINSTFCPVLILWVGKVCIKYDVSI